MNAKQARSGMKALGRPALWGLGLILTILVGMSLLPTHQSGAPAVETLVCPGVNVWSGPTPNPADGVIAPGEYAGANVVRFPGYGGQVTMYLRHDGSNLYVAFDLPDTTPWGTTPGGPGPAVQLFLDANHDGGTLPHTDDEVEVHLSVRARHQAEYVHLRDPRPSGCEPVTLVSGYKWDLGLARYEEIRDSGTNFFMEWLPEGEYTLKHRMRCAMAGTFKAAPATLQSMYAPEFAAYSAGAVITVK